MLEFWKMMGPAATAALVMSPVHALFGLHIVRRGLIFIDLAVAQVAALGMAFAIGFGYEVHSAEAYRYAVGFALGGALLISLTRFRLGRVPHEAIIGIVYVIATAGAVIVLEFSPTGHGLEELKHMLAGNILFVTDAEVRSTTKVYVVVLLLALLFWRNFSKVTLQRTDGLTGWKVVLLDFAFYAMLGFVVASSVKVAGVLVVFSWLVMPAVVAFFFCEHMTLAALIAVPLGMVGSLAGLALSYYGKPLPFPHAHDEPSPIEAAGLSGWATGPSIVVALGAVVVLCYLVRLFLPDRHERVNSAATSGAVPSDPA